MLFVLLFGIAYNFFFLDRYDAQSNNSISTPRAGWGLENEGGAPVRVGQGLPQHIPGISCVWAQGCGSEVLKPS